MIRCNKKFEKTFSNYSLVNIRNSNDLNILNANSKKDYQEIDNDQNAAFINIELKNSDNNNEDVLIIQINLKDFSYQEVDFNLKNYFSFDALASKINKNLNDKDFKETIEFNLPSENNYSENNHISKRKTSLENKLILNFNEKQNTLFGMKISSKPNGDEKEIKQEAVVERVGEE